MHWIINRKTRLRTFIRCKKHLEFVLQNSPKSFVHVSRFFSSRAGFGSQGETTKPYFITTPIFYVNAEPHIGHMYTACLADAIQRFQQLQGRDTIFCTGTDEHGLKVQQAAEKHKVHPKAFCDRVSGTFKVLFGKCNVDYTDFIRTTEERHKRAVNEFWNVLVAKGYIYKGSYEGWYSVNDECFVSEAQVQDAADGSGKVSIESGHPVEWNQEENYMFRLSLFRSELDKWLDEEVVQPSVYKGLAKSYLQNLTDLSISRGRERLSWGIPVPGDDTQTIYVWLDALVNYLTVGGYPEQGFHWPADCHVVGKDILKFHAIYWPAFLMAAGLDPPRNILCHSHWLRDQKKMSKSKGNVVNPMEVMDRVTPEGLRYFLLRTGMLEWDADFTDERLIDVLNSELANVLGNIVSRVTAKKLNPKHCYPPFMPEVWEEFCQEEDRVLLEKLKELPGKFFSVKLLLTIGEVTQHYQNYHVPRAADAISEVLHLTNQFLDRNAPWKLIKDPTNACHVSNILHIATEASRVSAILLQPIIPCLADQLLTYLNIPPRDRMWDSVGKTVTDQRAFTSKQYIFFERLQS
ncbi:methionine--tRNA ligase, mitochondrial [Lingula anatina]|uniref:Methionine--tRNA ligase, mitochondrial n=1 Tax=Lingula anatina TaxID=7574 RepID=A0A1S3H7U4_LINAN|nr:methionine--tRNA ligase, mitochondrial [Lingula anatina]|eukprot:XP_013381189.1 methionine--tRNA ligase, mitochondrial [Lingula anatina]